MASKGDPKGSSAGVSDLEPFELERFFAKWEFCASHLLCCSDCEPLAVKDLLAHADSECLELWDKLVLGYTMSTGSDELRKEIAGLYDTVGVDEINVVVPEEGIYLSMIALLKQGDHVVVTFPGYQSLYEIARSLGCHLHYWKPRSDEHGQLSFCVDDLNSILDENPVKLVVMNFPHNPTGKSLTTEQHAAVVGKCKEKNAYLFGDEMYRLLEYEPSCRLKSNVDCYDKAIILSGVSKALSCPGLRIGWIASHDKQFMSRLAELKDYTTICPSGPSEVLALMAIRQADRIVKNNLDIIKENIALLVSFIGKYSQQIKWDPPQAGSIAFPKIVTDKPIDAFCEDLVKKQDVLLLPSTVYGDKTFAKDKRVRFGLGRKGISEGLERLGRFLEEC